jgi:hypothetical protein
MGMTYKLWQKMSTTERDNTLAQAGIYLKNIDDL